MKKYFLTLLLALVLTTATANADTKIYGKTYGEWSAEWQKWAFAGPKGSNVVEDQTGEFCDLNQPNNNIWFLAGSFGKTGAVVRDCTIPPNRALFYPIIERGWIDCPPPSTDATDYSDADVRKIVAILSGGDGASLLASTLDGVPISSLQVPIVRTQSPKFTSILPGNNIMGNPGCSTDPDWNYPAGTTGRQILEGYWIMLPPLSAGVHVLTLRGATAEWILDANGANHGASQKWSFENEVTYNLTVLKERHH
jgi:hypothetical protein